MQLIVVLLRAAEERLKDAVKLVQVLPKGRFWEMISFEFHLEKWHEKTQKPLWLLGFSGCHLFW